MRGELGAVELTLWDSGGVSVRSLTMRTAWAMAGVGIGADAVAEAWPVAVAMEPSWRKAGGGRTARCCSGSEKVGDAGGGDDEASELCMTSLARADCFACRWPTSKWKK